MTEYATNAQVLNIAASLHFGQTRWGGEAYIVHPIAVAKEALSFVNNCAYLDVDEDVVYQTAILHDVLEDCEVTQEELRTKFNVRPSVIVNCNVLNKKNYGDYTEYIRGIIDSNNEIVAIVKYFDIQNNSVELQKGAKLDKYKLAQELLRTTYTFLPES